jgi:hypothetical protein
MLLPQQVRTFFSSVELMSAAQMPKMSSNNSVTVLFEDVLGFSKLGSPIRGAFNHKTCPSMRPEDGTIEHPKMSMSRNPENS